MKNVMPNDVQVMYENHRGAELYLPNGATPMTAADAITRELGRDREFLEATIFFINAYIEHELPHKCVSAPNEPKRQAPTDFLNEVGGEIGSSMQQFIQSMGGVDDNT